MATSRLKRLLISSACIGLGLYFNLPASGATPESAVTTAWGADGTSVSTEDGPVKGFIDDGRLFLGIPYAAPPVGALRWRPPTPHKHWSTPLSATHFGGRCAQVTTLGVFAGPPTTNEDCLFLNVFAPREKHSEKLPVLVWIHGGGFYDGESNDYDGRKLANRGPAIVVTINYRLGLFGYLAHPALDTDTDPFGNYGLMDQQMVLHWVHNNIAHFGGDPDNVTVGGQSAGSASTAANVISPAAKGLFHRAIFQSVELLAVPSLSIAEQRGVGFATAAGCPGGKSVAVAACLRGLSASKVLDLQGTARANGPYVNGLMVDGQILPMSAETAFSTGQFNHMPIMNGSTEDEWTFLEGVREYFSGPPRTTLSAAEYVADIFNTFRAYPTGTVAAVLNEYPLSAYATPALAADAWGTDARLGVFACPTQHLNQILSKQVPVYAYEFDDRTAPFYFPQMPGFVPLASHTIDIQFLFPRYHGGMGIAHPLNVQEARLSDQLVSAWTNFAKTGNPNGTGNTPWPRYESSLDAPEYLSENVPALSTLTGAQYVSRHHCAFWDKILTY